MIGGPLVKDRTFFFVDYQGQRQSIGRTVTSNVPTLTERSGVFRQNIYDPATTVGNTRQQFPNNTIPRSAMDPVALSLLERYPLPTNTATANNYSRTANEVDDQDQGDVRIDHKFATGRDQAFGRLTHFRGHAEPVTAFPDGSGTILAGSVAVGPQDTTAWAFASNYQHTFSANVLNEVRIGDTRRAVQRSAVSLSSPAGAALNIPGIPSSAQFPNTMPTFAPNGYQQLGSPNNTASDFSTSVTQIADSLTWLKGRHTMKMGLDWRWERLNVVQPPSPTGSFAFSTVGSDLPGVAGTGNAFASFLLGQVQTFAIDLQQTDIQERAHFQEYFIQDDWKVSDRFTINAGLRYTLNFPSTEINGQTAVFNLQTRQLEYPGTEPVRPLKKDNFGPRIGAVYRLTDKTIVSSGYGKVWIEMAGITTPFTTPNFPFLQTVSQRTLDNIAPAFELKNGPTVTPVGATPSAGLGQGVFTVDAELGSGYAQQWNVSVQRELTTNTVFEVSYLGSKITNIGIPDSNINQLTEEQLKQGSTLLERVPNPFFGIIPRSSSIGDPTITRAQLMKPYPDYTAVSFYRNNVGTTNYQGLAFSIRQRMSARPDLLGRLHPFEADRHRFVCVRRVHSDRTADERRRRRQSQSGARPRLLDRRHSALLRRLGRVGSSGWRGPCQAPHRRGRRTRERLERRDVHDHAVRGAGRGDAGELARLRRLHDPAPESRWRSDIARRRADTRSLVQHGRVRNGQPVHDRIRLAQSGAGAVVSRRRSRRDA